MNPTESELSVIIKQHLVIENPKGVPFCVNSLSKFFESKNKEITKIIFETIDEDTTGELEREIKKAFGEMTERDKDILGLALNLLYKKLKR